MSIIRRTFSLCPVCFRKVLAVLETDESENGAQPQTVFLRKNCPEHGQFGVPVWKNRIDLAQWIDREEPLSEKESADCSGNCRTCAGGSLHGQDVCCVVLEVTKRCNLHCEYCFARGGDNGWQPSFEELCGAVDDIVRLGKGPLIQFAGGEPTLREDLPELIKYARAAGTRFTQINTNGIRLAEDEDYVQRLAEAGLDIVFLQFDGLDDAIYRKLRGRDLLETKLRAIANCDKYRIGVTLVPTIVRGVNEKEIGTIIRAVAGMFPAVKSVHFQPVTYLGRYPEEPDFSDRYTLDDLMADLCAQTGIPETALLPSRCDHAMCEFHSTFFVNAKKQLIPVSDRSRDVRRERTPARKNREYVAEHWRRNPEEERTLTKYESPLAADNPQLSLVCRDNEEMDFDEFVRRMRSETLKISAMAFQDAMNIDLERLYRCGLNVYENGKILPFCSKYLTPVR